MTVDGMSKGNWIAMAALCVTLVSGMYSLTVVPVQTKSHTLEDKIEKVEDRVGQLEKTQHGLSIKLGHIKASLERIEDAVVKEK